MLRKYGWWLGLLGVLAACQPQSDAGVGRPAATPPTGHFAGTLAAAGQPELRAALEVRHPRPGHYDAELRIDGAPSLSFVADTLDYAANRLRLRRPGQPGEVLALQRQGDFWRGTLAVDSISYPVLLVRRGLPEPAVYQVQRDEIAGPPGTALLFSPADESLPGAALALFPTAATEGTAPAWADNLARQGYTVLLLPPADTLSARALTAALTHLRRTPGVDTARVGAWVAGSRAAALATLLTGPALPRPYPTFILAQTPPALTADTRRAWRILGQRTPVLGLYEAPDAATAQAANGLRTALGGRRGRVVRGSGAASAVSSWLREQ